MDGSAALPGPAPAFPPGAGYARDAGPRLSQGPYAIGANPQAARLSGINTVGIIGLLYVIVALFAGLSGILQTSRVGLAAPNVAKGLEFDVIVAIILGGTAMTGGVGSTIGMLLGALVVCFASNGLILLGIPFYYQSIAYGVILIGSLMLNQRFTVVGRA